MWWYLESDFSLQDALNNPYGPGRRSRDADVEDLPIKCPQFDYLTDEQAAEENVDTTDELEFGELKRQERHDIITGDMQPVISGPKRTSKKSECLQRSQTSPSPSTINMKSTVYHTNPVFSVHTNLSTEERGSRVNSPAPVKGGTRNKFIQAAPKREYPSDSDQTRSTSPAHRNSKQRAGMGVLTVLNDESSPVPAPKPKGPGRGNWRRNKDPNAVASAAAPRSQPKTGTGELGPSGPHGFYLQLNGTDPTPSSNKRARPPTSHQLALEKYRKERVNHILDRGLRSARASAGRKRKREAPIQRAWKRCKGLDSGWDSEEEAHITAAGRIGAAKMGLAMGGFGQNDWESPNWGEESAAVAHAFRRMRRRLDRYEGGDGLVATSIRKGKRAVRDKPRSKDSGAEDMEMDDLGSDNATRGWDDRNSSEDEREAEDVQIVDGPSSSRRQVPAET
jgi:Ino eighty subunit 1